MSAPAREPCALLLRVSSVPILLLTLALVANFFWRAQLFTGNNLPPVVLLAVLFTGAWLLRGLGVTGSLPVRFPAVFWPLALYVLAVLLSIAVRQDFAERTIQHALRLLVLLLLALLVSNLVRDLGALESVTYMLIAGFTLAALYGFADYALRGRYFLDAFVGLDRKNASGYYFMAILPFALFTYRSPRAGRLGKRLLAGAFVLCFAAMLLTLARSALIGLLAGLGMVFLLYGRRLDWRLVLALGALGVAASFLAPETVTRRLSTTLDFEQREATSNSSRVILLNAGLRMAADYPLLGVGVGRFDENLERYITREERDLLGFETYEASHNQYVAALNDGGVLALAAVLLLLAVILWGLHRRLRRPDVPRRYLLLAFAAFWWAQAAHFFVEWQLARELFWFMAGLTGAALSLTRPLPAEAEPEPAFVLEPR